MRADRLLSLLMLLQARGRLTAQELARELEVSERTIYRDVDALSTAGVPIYAEYGQGGGYGLLDSYRTNLTGLNEDEVRALFMLMLNVPAPLAELGVGQELKAALLKLSAALPPAHAGDQSQVRQRIHLDSAWWFQAEEPVPHLRTIQQAVWEDRRVHLAYRLPVGGLHNERLVDPYGLVAKAGIWYVVYAGNGRIRAHRVSQILDARITDRSFVRPADFDLAVFWQSWCTYVEQNRLSYPVIARIAPDLVPELPSYFGDGIRTAIAQAGPPDREGWITLTLPFDSLVAARERLLGFGRAIEVLEPAPLRLSILDFATQIVGLYTRKATDR